MSTFTIGVTVTQPNDLSLNSAEIEGAGTDLETFVRESAEAMRLDLEDVIRAEFALANTELAREGRPGGLEVDVVVQEVNV
jgi:hypothetical protein